MVWQLKWVHVFGSYAGVVKPFPQTHGGKLQFLEIFQQSFEACSMEKI